MWDDVIIGTGNSGPSAHLTVDIEKLQISENQMCYWVTGAILGLGCTIFKYTEEGKQLSEFLKDMNKEKIQNLIDTAILKNASVSKFRNAIAVAMAAAKRDGADELLKKIHDVLDIQ